MKQSIRLTGTGGQGNILAGIILAEGALIDGKKAIQSQSYGPEARGGASKAEVLISDSEIHHPKVIKSDVLLSMSQKAYDKYSVDMADDSILIIDTTFVTVDECPKAKTIYRVPITDIAIDEAGKEMVANIVALGVIAGLGTMVSEAALKEAVLKRIPKGTEEINTKAFEAGVAAIKKQLA